MNEYEERRLRALEDMATSARKASHAFGLFVEQLSTLAKIAQAIIEEEKASRAIERGQPKR